MGNQFKRSMTDTMLVPLRHMYQGSHLICNASVDPTEEAYMEYEAMPAGRCMHLTNATGPGATAVAKLGCTGNSRIPVHIFHDSDQYSVGQGAVVPPDDGGPNWAIGAEGQRILFFVGFEGFELATTEFIGDHSLYKVGEPLKAIQMDDASNPNTDDQGFARDVAGKLDRDTVRHGLETIVGYVSPGAIHSSPYRKVNDTRDPYGNYLVSFYTTYRPALEGIPAGIPNS